MATRQPRHENSLQTHSETRGLKKLSPPPSPPTAARLRGRTVPGGSEEGGREELVEVHPQRASSSARRARSATRPLARGSPPAPQARGPRPSFPAALWHSCLPHRRISHATSTGLNGYLLRVAEGADILSNAATNASSFSFFSVLSVPGCRCFRGSCHPTRSLQCLQPSSTDPL